jgi:septal ring factor EnvC (AmiA/AmiB activator)
LIAIGNLSAGGVAYEKFYVGAVYGVTTALGATLPVIVSSEGQLGTTASAARFKKEIRPMDKISESVLALKPVTFHYKSDKTNTPQFGLVAEDVAEVNPDLVVRDKNGEIYTVRYDAVNAMLLNEFLKEHRKVEQQGQKIQEQDATIARQREEFDATITALKKEMATVVAHANEQDSKIQKVSDQVQMNSSAARVVVSNH